MKLKTLILSLIFFSSACFPNENLKIYIDDSKVSQDTFYPGCINKLCKKKAKKLKKHYLKSKVKARLNKQISNVLFVDKPSDDMLAITLGSYNTHPRKDIISFAVINVTLGTAPIKMKYGFSVKLELVENGNVVRSIQERFHEKRKVSLLSDTQDYKKRAAKRIVKIVEKFI